MKHEVGRLGAVLGTLGGLVLLSAALAMLMFAVDVRGQSGPAFGLCLFAAVLLGALAVGAWALSLRGFGSGPGGSG